MLTSNTQIMIRSTTIKANDKTLDVIKKMAAMKEGHRKAIIEKVKESRK